MKISRFLFTGAPLLESLPKNEARYIQEHGKERRLQAGVELFREGTQPRLLYILLKGRVKIFQTTSGGNEQIVYIYEPGDMFGYRPILCNEKHPVSARTIEEVTLIQLSRIQFIDLLQRSSSLARILLRNLSAEFSVWVSFITIFAQYPAKVRLALSLLILSSKHPSPKSALLPEVSLSRKDLASISGTTVETTARTLTSWKNEGIISSKGRKIIIKDAGHLSSLID